MGQAGVEGVGPKRNRLMRVPSPTPQNSPAGIASNRTLAQPLPNQPAAPLQFSTTQPPCES